MKNSNLNNQYYRLFIAVDFNKELKNKIYEIYKELSPISTFIKLVNPENIHITLKFFANFPLDSLPMLYELIENQTNKINTFILKISELGIFPDLKHPRIFWLGIKEGARELQLIQSALEESLNNKALGNKEQKPFSPHITIARVKEFKGISKYLEKINFKNQVFQNIGTEKVESIKLFRSVLTPSGPEYTILKTFNLLN